MAIDTPEMEALEWESLSERQRSQAESYTVLATEYGMFDQTSGANGAHYAPASKNPFKSEGLKCGNCIFFNEENSQCQIVAGKIEAEAICKLWITPENTLNISDPAQLESMSPSEIMDAKRSGRLNSIIGN